MTEQTPVPFGADEHAEAAARIRDRLREEFGPPVPQVRGLVLEAEIRALKSMEADCRDGLADFDPDGANAAKLRGQQGGLMFARTRLEHMAGVTVQDGTTVVFEGRPYRVQVDTGAQCTSLRHWHAEPHADGTPGTDKHHHHETRCADMPRQLTLVPAWERVPKHVHEFTGGRCECGARREELTDPKAAHRRPGDPQPQTRRMGYHMPADDTHPDGWSYERREEVPGDDN